MSISNLPNKGEQLYLTGPGDTVTFIKLVHTGQNPIDFFTLLGSPEGVITATPGSVAFDLNGLFWWKRSGSGNTGWVYGNTDVQTNVLSSSYILTSSYVDVVAVTADLTGTWRVDAIVDFAPDTADGSSSVQLLVNGSANSETMICSGTTGLTVPGYRSWIVTANNGDIIKIQAKKNGGAGGSSLNANSRIIATWMHL